MPLERGGKLAWNQRQGIAVADLDRPTALELAAVRGQPLARRQGGKFDAASRVKPRLPRDLEGWIADWAGLQQPVWNGLEPFGDRPP